MSKKSSKSKHCVADGLPSTKGASGKKNKPLDYKEYTGVLFKGL